MVEHQYLELFEEDLRSAVFAIEKSERHVLRVWAKSEQGHDLWLYLLQTIPVVLLSDQTAEALANVLTEEFEQEEPRSIYFIFCRCI